MLIDEGPSIIIKELNSQSVSQKIREEADLILAEDNLRTQQMTLMVNQNETDNNDGCDEDTLAGKFRESLCSLYEQRQKLKKDIRKVNQFNFVSPLFSNIEHSEL